NPDWPAVSVGNDQCLVSPQAKEELTRDNKLDLEVFQYNTEDSEAVAQIGQWLADNALDSNYTPAFFRDQLARHLVVLSDTDFGHFVLNATLVETHVRIDETTGTAANGG